VAQDRNRWRALVNEAMNLRVGSIKCGIYAWDHIATGIGCCLKHTSYISGRILIGKRQRARDDSVSNLGLRIVHLDLAANFVKTCLNKTDRDDLLQRVCSVSYAIICEREVIKKVEAAHAWEEYVDED
jgi:hypothetical protein